MAIDTQAKRQSAELFMLHPHTVIPDGSIDQHDRRDIAFCYRSILDSGSLVTIKVESASTTDYGVTASTTDYDVTASTTDPDVDLSTTDYDVTTSMTDYDVDASEKNVI